MRKVLSLALIFSLILSMFTGLNMLSASAAADDYKISLEMPEVLPSIGDTFEAKVNVEIKSGKELSGAGFAMSIPSELSVQDITLQGSMVNGFSSAVTHADKITFALFAINGMTPVTLTGNATIAIVTFTVDSLVDNDLVIALSDVEMSNETGANVPAADINKDEAIVNLPTVDGLLLKNIQFDFTHNATPKFPLSGFAPFSITAGNPTKYLERGEEYEMKVYLSDIKGIDSFTLPMEFDRNVVQIVNLALGDAWTNTGDYDMFPIYSRASNPGRNAAMYEAGNSAFKLNEVNSLGAFLLTFESNEGKKIDIGDIDSPINPLENHFFTVTFRVKDDAAYGATTGFGPTGKLQNITSADYLSYIDGVNTHTVAHNVMVGGQDKGLQSFPVGLGSVANQPKVIQREINIIAPVTNENNYDMPVSVPTVVLGCDVLDVDFAAIIGNDVLWNVIAPNGSDVTDNVLVGKTTKTPTFKPNMSGVYTISVDAGEHSPYAGKGYGSWITITVAGGATISGRAMLMGKYREAAPIFTYTSRGNALDAGIKVELVKGKLTDKISEQVIIGKPVYTDAVVTSKAGIDCNFKITLSEEVVDSISAKNAQYFLRFTRIGESEDGLNDREESYLVAELEISKDDSSIDRNGDLILDKVVYLSAGAFSGAGAGKIDISASDVNTIKNLVGSATDGTDGAISVMFNINEYANVDAGDLSNVRKLQDNVKKVGTVQLAGSVGLVTLTQ